MRILVTNDDGINAEGLYQLYKKLSKKFSLTICAPEAEQSAIGHAITLSQPLRIKKIYKNSKFFGYALNGTPADCVKIAVRTLLKEKPQLIFSGINHGPNLGSDLMYSGTVSAATEGTILGISSVAISLATYKNYDFSYAAEIAYKMAKLLEKNKLPDGVLLNINIPATSSCKIRGVLVTRQGRSKYEEEFVQRIDPRGRPYYWLTGKVKWLEKPEGSDIKAIEDNFVSITPLQLDLTDYKFIEELKKLILNKDEISGKYY